jgi:hypothetical protein
VARNETMCTVFCLMEQRCKTDEGQVHFFAQLTIIGVITPESMLALLRSFISVLDEPGVAYERASLAAVCVGEGLLHVSITPATISAPHPLTLL